MTDADPRTAVFANAVARLPDDLVTRPGAFAWLEGDALAETELFGHLHDEHEASIRAWLADRD